MPDHLALLHLKETVDGYLLSNGPPHRHILRPVGAMVVKGVARKFSQARNDVFDPPALREYESRTRPQFAHNGDGHRHLGIASFIEPWSLWIQRVDNRLEASEQLSFEIVLVNV